MKRYQKPQMRVGATNRMAVRILSLLMCCSLLLTGCGKEKEEQSFAELAELMIECGVVICNDIYLGSGLDADVPENFVPNPDKGTYYPVVSDRYTSIADLKDAAEAVFLPSTAEQWLYGDAFGEYPASGSDVSAAAMPLYKEIDGVLMVNTSFDGATAYGTEWLYDTLKVIEYSEESASVTIDTIYRDEKAATVTVKFVNTEEGWRISTPLMQPSNDVSEWQE